MNKTLYLPAIIGECNLSEALQHPKIEGYLWLEILLNDKIKWPELLDNPLIAREYFKACCWYCAYSKMISWNFQREPLPKEQGYLDMRMERRFWEMLRWGRYHYSK